MTAGLSKAILPIRKSTSRMQIRESKQPILHYFMRFTNSKYSEKERIGAIDEGFTCLAVQTAQNLAFEGLEDYPITTQLNNDNRTHKPQYINNTVHQTSSTEMIYSSLRTFERKNQLNQSYG
jgi:hypothetical protein